MNDRRTIRNHERAPERLAVAGVGCGLTALAALVALGLGVVLLARSCEIEVGRHPGEGTRSERLAVTVSPRSGLGDGATVTVSSAAFEPHEIVGVAVCIRDADAERQGVDACDTISAARFATTATGTLSATFTVPRQIRVRGRVVDCAAPDTPCLIVAADIDDYDRSGGQEIEFRTDLGPAVGAPPRRRPNSLLLPISGTPASPVASGSAVEVVATGFQPGEPLVVARCHRFPRVDAPHACDPLSSDGLSAALGVLPEAPDAVAAPDGTFRTAVDAAPTVRPYLADETPKGAADCSTEDADCSIVVAAIADLTRSAVLPYRVAAG